MLGVCRGWHEAPEPHYIYLSSATQQALDRHVLGTAPGEASLPHPNPNNTGACLERWFLARRPLLGHKHHLRVRWHQPVPLLSGPLPGLRRCAGHHTINEFQQRLWRELYPHRTHCGLKCGGVAVVSITGREQHMQRRHATQFQATPVPDHIVPLAMQQVDSGVVHLLPQHHAERVPHPWHIRGRHVEQPWWRL